MAGFLSKLLGGVNKFSDEMLMPSTGLGRLGAMLGAASGSSLGQASIMAQQDKRQRDHDAAEKEDRVLSRMLREAQLTKALRPDTGGPLAQKVADLRALGASNEQIQSLIANEVAPPPFVQKNPDGTSTIYPGGIPRISPPQAKPSGPPQQAIDYLRANPNLAPDFDAKYGPGSAASILKTGGASPTGSPTFP